MMEDKQKSKTLPFVLQIKNGCFLPRSETFIYNYLTHLKKYSSIVITQEIANLGNFPFEPIELLPYVDSISNDFREQVLQLKQKYNPALIHAHFGPSGVYGLLFKKILNIPLITSFHGWDVSAALNEPHWIKAYDKLFKDGDFFTGTSEYMRGQLRRAGCPEAKIRILHVGIDLNKFNFKPKSKTFPAKVSFLSVGRLVQKKGMDDTIKAFAIVNASYPETELQIIGDGPLRDLLCQLVKKLGLNGKVIFRGECSYNEVSEQMRESQIFVLASKTAVNGDQEGTTMVTKEALASGMPVLATRHSGIPEVVVDGISGFLVDEGDHINLSKKMIDLIEHPEVWPEMATRGRRHVEQHFNIVTETEKLECVYHEAMNDCSQNKKKTLNQWIRRILF